MWLFNKDSTNTLSTVGTIGLAFSGEVVPGFSIYPGSEQFATVNAPYRLEWHIKRACNKKKNNEDVSLFSLRLLTSGLSLSDVDLLHASLRQTVKWMKTLRHPNILNWIAGTDVTGPKLPDEFHVITERVVTLREYLRTKADSGNFQFISSWGIHQISRAVAFLNDDGKIAHNALRLDAVFVTVSGEWKLGSLDFVGPVHQPPPIIRSTAAFGKSASTGCDPYLPPDHGLVDSWGLGCLIWEIFNPNCSLRDRTQLTSATSMQRLPRSLVPDYRRLVAQNPTRGAKRRCTVAQFIARSRNPDKKGFLANEYVDTLLFLEEIQLKDAQEKTRFFSTLSDQIANFPDDVCRHKILPHLLNGLRFGSAGIEALIPVLRLIPLVSTADFQSDVLPCLVKLFASPERATRVRLLEQLPNFITNLPPKVVETQVFQSVATGFSDANPVVREATVRAMVHLAPKLSGKMLNDTLPRYLIATQTKDDQGGIRTNATICLAKLAPSFSAQVQQGVLLNAFLRATRDSFVPSRKAALAALTATQGLYKTDQLAGKLLPCLSFLTVDPDKCIRDDTFRAIRGVLERLEQISENPSAGDAINTPDSSSAETEAKLTASRLAAAALSNLAWSALSFSSRLISNIKTSDPTSSETPPTTMAIQHSATDTAAARSSNLTDVTSSTTEKSTSHAKSHTLANSAALPTASKPMSLRCSVDFSLVDADLLAEGDDRGCWNIAAAHDDWTSLDLSETESSAQLPEISRDQDSPCGTIAASTTTTLLDWDADKFLDSFTNSASMQIPLRSPSPSEKNNRKPVPKMAKSKTNPKTSAPIKSPLPLQSQPDDGGWDDW